MTTTPLADQAHRQQALDIRGSYIVQAPAGSGKTELLTLRFLKLLAICEQPEQVLAITFTKKAANEMSKRIIDALQWAQQCLAQNINPDNALQQQRLTIAQDVLAQNARQQWHLLENPARLRVQTIDSFCFYLARQLPILSQLGGSPRVNDDVTPCFKDAISNTLKQLESSTPLSDDIAALLTHLDNDMGKTERLLLTLLRSRDQWMSHAISINHSFADAQLYLQQGLTELVEESLDAVSAALKPYETKLLPLLNFAAENLQRDNSLSEQSWIPHITLPESDYSAMPYWLFITDSLLTKKAEWRRTITKTNGFPPGDKGDKEHIALCKMQKAAMLDLLSVLQTDDELLAALEYVRLLPDPALNRTSWQFLASLTRVLAHLSSQLLLSFTKFRVIDHTQTSAAARTALGDEDAPTDLALVLDNRIQHVLVDEFQDTSQMQLDILQQLTAGWMPGDGRTLFLVGDAMQSCYAFRNANVGIYLNVRANGLGNIPVTPLTLETNFRSTETVVDWVNDVFATSFPSQPNSSRGAVPYTPSIAIHDAVDGHSVSIDLFVHEQGDTALAREREAAHVLATIIQLQQDCPGQSIAILVRARPHLNYIIPALRQAGIKWQATDIDRLTALPAIEDLLSLTRAICNQADRLAWMSILRAPWCGLTINDLHAVSMHAGDNSIWRALTDVASIYELSSDGAARLQGMLPVLHYAMGNRFRMSLRSLLETCWELLGGPDIAASDIEHDSVARFFDLLGEHETGMGLADIDEFTEVVASAYVPNRSDPDTADTSSVHLLTMHKAKGLEYDHVILPGLGLLPMRDEKLLLQWYQRLNQQGDTRLYLSTLSAPGTDDEALYKLLRYEQQHKNLLESTRLLYIAVTRARYSVHMSATLRRKAAGDITPDRASLLGRIWRHLGSHPELASEIEVTPGMEAANDSSATASDTGQAPTTLTPVTRLAQPLQINTEALAHVTLPALPETTDTENAPADFSLQDDATIGTVIHRSLESLSRACGNPASAIHGKRLEALRENWRLQLRSITASEQELSDCITIVEKAVINTLSNPSLQWLYDESSQEKESEAALSRQKNGYGQHFKIDRTLVDKKGTRWIIDYKTAQPGTEESEETFINAQLRQYAPQLQNYRHLYESLESRPIKCALLFTALGKLVELTP